MKHTPLLSITNNSLDDELRNTEKITSRFFKRINNDGLGLTVNEEDGHYLLTIGSLDFQPLTTRHTFTRTIPGQAPTLSTIPGVGNGGINGSYFKTILTKEDLQPMPVDFDVNPFWEDEVSDHTSFEGIKCYFSLNNIYYKTTYNRVLKTFFIKPWHLY